MADPGGLTLGIIALAGLFSTCIECFDYFKAGQELEERVKILLVKLDLQKMRLLMWGNHVGVLLLDGRGRSVELSNKDMADSISNCLGSIMKLLSDSTTFRNKYGLQLVELNQIGRISNGDILSNNNMNIFVTSYKRFCVRFADFKSNSTLLKKTRWAIHDKEKFEVLITDVKDLIDNLFDVMPMQRGVQDQIMEEDIASIPDISSLSLLEKVFKEGKYSKWEKAASDAIEATERGTIDPRNDVESFKETQYHGGEVDGRINDKNITASTRNQRGMQSRQDPLFTSIPALYLGGQLHFVLTEQCDCFSPHLLFQGTPPQYGCNFHINKTSSNSSRIAPTLEQHKVSTLIHETLSIPSLLESKPNNLGGSKMCPIYVYCAICPYQVATALDISECLDGQYPVYTQYRVRPDPRLPVSCCSLVTDSKAGLRTLITALRCFEFSQKLLSRIDQQWVEQRLHELERSDQPLTRDIRHGFSKVLSSGEETDKCAAIIILGEARYSSQILQMPPFEYDPFISRETEIYHIKPRWQEGKQIWARKFLACYNPKRAQRVETRDEIPLVSGRSTPIQGGLSRENNLGKRPASKRSNTSDFSSQKTSGYRDSRPPSPASKRQRTESVVSLEMRDMDLEGGRSVLAGEENVYGVTMEDDLEDYVDKDDEKNYRY